MQTTYLLFALKVFNANITFFICICKSYQPYTPGQKLLHHALLYLFVFGEFGFQCECVVR